MDTCKAFLSIPNCKGGSPRIALACLRAAGLKAERPLIHLARDRLAVLLLMEIAFLIWVTTETHEPKRLADFHRAVIVREKQGGRHVDRRRQRE